MKSDSDTMQQTVLELIQRLLANDEPGQSISAPPGECSEKQGDPLIQQKFIAATTGVASLSSADSAVSPAEKNYLLELGDLPAVQDRFYALIKRRFESEIERNPPLFPWESEVMEYGTEPVGAQIPVAVGEVAPLWRTQLQRFKLPVQLPEAVFAQLLQRCQEVVHASLLEGAKLVRVVEDLFPEEGGELNRLAGFVIAAPARSTNLADSSLDSSLDYPRSYESAAIAQQMALSLMAARELLHLLTLTVSADSPQMGREWLTELGALMLQVSYHPASPTSQSALRVTANLPCGGTIQLAGQGRETHSRCPEGGELTVELPLVSAESGVLTVQLQPESGETCALTFAVRVD